MIVNSDERQYWWMDEGLNSFCQFLTEQEFDNNYPSRRGPPHLITDYMRLPKEQLEPIMTKGDVLLSVGSNAYAKASTGLNILRETVMGRELFDYAFKEYARRWAFKHPTPADFFRTMEDASGVDLDWYWRGWFFGTEPVDLSLDSLKWYKMEAYDNASKRQAQFETLSKLRNRNVKELTFAVEADTSLRDFYYFNPGSDAAYAQQLPVDLSAPLRDSTNRAKWLNRNFYELSFSNRGGMLMPIVLEWTYTDGSKEVQYVPVTIWRLNEKKATKVFIKDKEVAAVRLDPYKETADINELNGSWPVKEMPGRFQLFKQNQEIGRGQSSGSNSMQRALQQKKPD